jgi:hypothetical protein
MDCDRKRILELPIWRRFAAASLLGLFLATVTPLAPLLTAGLGLADRTHHVSIRQSEGATQVVLHHGRPDSPAHHHAIVARALMLIAEPPATGQPDHIIQFNAGATLERSAAFALGSMPKHSTPAFWLRFDPLRWSTGGMVGRATLSHSPPYASGALWQLRSTLLLL